jgi:hypothetical protein
MEQVIDETKEVSFQTADNRAEVVLEFLFVYNRSKLLR